MQQQLEKRMQWDEAQYNELTSVSEQANSLRLRDMEAVKIQPYTAPSGGEYGKEVEPVFNLEMKRYAAAGSVTTLWLCAFSLVEQGVMTGAAVVLGYVVAGGIGIGVVAAGLRNCLTWVPSGGGAKGETHHHHYYQNNQQGPSGSQSNQK